MASFLPLTFEQKVEVVLEGIFLDKQMIQDICVEIINDVIRYIKEHKMSSDISSIQTAINWTLYHKIMQK